MSTAASHYRDAEAELALIRQRMVIHQDRLTDYERLTLRAHIAEIHAHLANARIARQIEKAAE